MEIRQGQGTSHAVLPTASTIRRHPGFKPPRGCPLGRKHARDRKEGETLTGRLAWRSCAWPLFADSRPAPYPVAFRLSSYPSNFRELGDHTRSLRGREGSPKGRAVRFGERRAPARGSRDGSGRRAERCRAPGIAAANAPGDTVGSRGPPGPIRSRARGRPEAIVEGGTPRIRNSRQARDGARSGESRYNAACPFRNLSGCFPTTKTPKKVPLARTVRRVSLCPGVSRSVSWFRSSFWRVSACQSRTSLPRKSRRRKRASGLRVKQAPETTASGISRRA